MMNLYYNNSLNITNTTTYLYYADFHHGYWQTVTYYLLFVYVLSCAMTFNLKRCHVETYRENFICCCCMCYRDIISSLFMIVLYILLIIIECFRCSCISKKNSNKIKQWTRERIKNTKQYFHDKYYHCKFSIENRISPIQATIVEDTNINTSIVIEGLNSNHKVVSVLIVPMNEMII